MKLLKNSIVILALFSVGLTQTKQVTKATTPTKAIQPKPINITPTPKPTPINKPSTFNLGTFTCMSASVLPVYTQNQQEYVILTRESRGNPQEQGGKLHTYDDFSGACEAEDKYEPLLSAAREFHEEGNLKKTLGWSLNETINFVKNNIKEVIVYTKDIDKNIPGSRQIKNVTYVINFDKYKDKLFNNFYPVIEKEIAYYKKAGKSLRQVTLEKDKIAAVAFNDLKEAISYQKIISGASPVRVQALVRDEKTKKFNKEKIVLRPFLAIKLHSHFLNLSYEQGENSTIKHYH
jgi:hypothetical protein